MCFIVLISISFIIYKVLRFLFFQVGFTMDGWDFDSACFPEKCFECEENRSVREIVKERQYRGSREKENEGYNGQYEKIG